MSEKQSGSESATRRKFLARCGRFAAVTPPAVALMLAASRQNFAVAHSGAHDGGGYKSTHRHKPSYNKKHRS